MYARRTGPKFGAEHDFIGGEKGISKPQLIVKFLDFPCVCHGSALHEIRKFSHPYGLIIEIERQRKIA